MLGSIISAILNGFFSVFKEWLTARQLQEAQTKAEATQKAMQSVGRARALEDELRGINNNTEPPIDPYEGQKWVDRYGEVWVWQGGEFLRGDSNELQKDSETQYDVFGDIAFNHAD